MAKRLLRSAEKLTIVVDKNRALAVQIAELLELRQLVQAAEGAASRKAGATSPRRRRSVCSAGRGHPRRR